MSLITIKFRDYERPPSTIFARAPGKCDTSDNDRVPAGVLPFLEPTGQGVTETDTPRRCRLEAVAGRGGRAGWVDAIMKTTGVDTQHTKNTYSSISHNVKADIHPKRNVAEWSEHSFITCWVFGRQSHTEHDTPHTHMCIMWRGVSSFAPSIPFGVVAAAVAAKLLITASGRARNGQCRSGRRAERESTQSWAHCGWDKMWCRARRTDIPLTRRRRRRGRGAAVVTVRR